MSEDTGSNLKKCIQAIAGLLNDEEIADMDISTFIYALGASIDGLVNAVDDPIAKGQLISDITGILLDHHGESVEAYKEISVFLNGGVISSGNVNKGKLN